MITDAPEVLPKVHDCPGSFEKVILAPELYKWAHISPFWTAL